MVREKSPVDINGLPFSSLASDPNCKDVVSNCAQYQAGFCTNSAYQAWAAKNCKRHCGLCGKLTSCSDCKVVLHLTFDHLKWVTNKGLRALRAKMAPFGNGLSLCFFFCSLHHTNYKHVMAIKFEKHPSSKVCPTSVFQ